MSQCLKKELRRAITVCLICLPIFIILFSEWIVKIYGTLLLATVSVSFLHFFENKRSLLLKQVFVPVLILWIGVFFFSKILEIKKRIVRKGLLISIISILGIVSLAFAYIRLDVTQYIRYEYKNNQNKWYDSVEIAVHALGNIDGYAYTNCKEALEENYKKGNKLFECDFMMTRDEQLVACHDWETWHNMTVLENDEDLEKIPTLEEFQSRKIYGKYTPLSGRDIISFMKENSDVWIITDTKSAEDIYYKSQFAEMLDIAMEMNCPEVLDRIIIQIYHGYMLEDIKSIYTFPNFAYTLYQEGYRGESEEMEQYARFCRLSGIDVIVMNEKYYDDELLEICKRYGIHLMVHTINDKKNIEEFLQKGIGVYTDNGDFFKPFEG